MLVKVNSGKGETHININLEDVAKVVLGNRPGVRYVRGADSSVELKDGQKYLTDPEEAQRLIDAIRKLDEAGDSQ